MRAVLAGPGEADEGAAVVKLGAAGKLEAVLHERVTPVLLAGVGVGVAGTRSSPARRSGGSLVS